MQKVKSVQELIREAEQFDKTGVTTTSEFVTQSMRDDINRTEAYVNSKHISGDKDYLGRDKPFFNIVNSAVNITYRATQIERKDIKIRATKESDEIEAFLATILFQQWMKKAKFAKFLSDWGISLARHGSSICKFIEKDGELSCQVIDWNTVLVDPIDFENNIKVEKLWFTPAQLKQQKNYDQELVDKLLDDVTTRKTLEGQKMDNKSNFIPVYEVHGLLPLSLLTNKDKDDDEFVQQIHIVTFQAQKDNADGWNDYTLYSGKEAKDPYKLTHLIKKDGQTYAGGAVKNLFEAQWMVNHNEKQVKDQLDLASKIIFQTSDSSLAGQNALANIENGDMLLHKLNEPLTMLQNTPNIVAMQSSQQNWKSIANEINGISEAMQGEAPKAGTAWRQVQATLQESHSLFELMTTNKGLDLIDMMTDFIIPFFKKQLNHTDEINAILEEYQIKQIDSRYVPNEVNRRMNQKKKQTILSGQIYDPATEAPDAAGVQNEVQSQLKGNQRFIKPSDIDGTTWKEVFKDLEWELDIDVTGESKDVQGVLATLTTVLQTLAGNPAILNDQNMKMIFGRILSLSGAMSPIEIQSLPNQPAQPIQQAQPAPNGAQVGGAPMAQPQPA